MKKKQAKKQYFKTAVLIAAVLALTSCGAASPKDNLSSAGTSAAHSIESSQTAIYEQESVEESAQSDDSEIHFNYESIPEWSGEPAFVIEELPDIDEDEYAPGYVGLSGFDALGRTGEATAYVTADIMPEENRGSIVNIKPSGWQLAKYDFIDGSYLYNRAHLIGWQLIGNNEPENFITGTRYFNIQGMLPYENRVRDYVKGTNNDVIVKVTPIYLSNELIARGVHFQAVSADDPAGFHINVFCYNVQPGVEIDYLTGDNHADGTASSRYNKESEETDWSDTAEPSVPDENANSENNSTITPNEQKIESDLNGEKAADPVEEEYILNTNTKKFHYPYCDSVNDMKEKNKEVFSGTREDVIARGYAPCKRCNP